MGAGLFAECLVYSLPKIVHFLCHTSPSAPTLSPATGFFFFICHSFWVTFQNIFWLNLRPKEAFKKNSACDKSNVVDGL